jgi:hypothetical protein
MNSFSALQKPTRKAQLIQRPDPGDTVVARRNNVSGTGRLRVLLPADGTVNIY